MRVSKRSAVDMGAAVHWGRGGRMGGEEQHVRARHYAHLLCTNDETSAVLQRWTKLFLRHLFREGDSTTLRACVARERV